LIKTSINDRASPGKLDGSSNATEIYANFPHELLILSNSCIPRDDERHSRITALFCEPKDWIDYFVLVDVHRSQVTIEEQLVRLDVDGTLPSALGAEGPLRIYQAPECRSCNKIH